MTHPPRLTITYEGRFVSVLVFEESNFCNPRVWTGCEDRATQAALLLQVAHYLCPEAFTNFEPVPRQSQRDPPVDPFCCDGKDFHP